MIQNSQVPEGPVLACDIWAGKNVDLSPRAHFRAKKRMLRLPHQRQSFVGKMGILFPPMDKAKDGNTFSVTVMVVSALKAGFICACGSIFLNLLIYLSLKGSDYQSPIGFILELSNWSSMKYAAAMTVGPVIETLMFLIFWFSTYTSKFRQSIKDAIFIVIMTSLGFLLHGADWMAVSRAFGFFVLAMLFAGWVHRGSIRPAFWTTALGHCFWNGFALLIIMAMAWTRS